MKIIPKIVEYQCGSSDITQSIERKRHRQIPYKINPGPLIPSSFLAIRRIAGCVLLFRPFVQEVASASQPRNKSPRAP